MQKPKKPTVNPFTPCEICEEPVGKRGTVHHLSYEPEITAIVCFPCHQWLHGQSRIFKHIIKTKCDRATAPFVFAALVVKLYKEKLLIPIIRKITKEQEKENTKELMDKILINGAGNKETSH